MNIDSSYKLFWWCILSVAVKSLIFCNNIVPVNIVFSSFGLFKSIFIFLSFAIVSVPFLLILLCFYFLFRAPGKNWYIFVVNLIVSVVFIIDLWYYRAFEMPMTAFLYMQQSCLEQLETGILSLIQPVDLVYILDLPWFAYQARNDKNLSGPSIGRFGMSLLVSLILIIALVQGFNFDGERKQAVLSLSLLGYHTFDTIEVIRNQTIEPSESDQQRINDWLEEHMRLNTETENSWKGIFKGRNIIVIQFESLESFVIDALVEDNEITPNINKMLKNSLYFTNLYEQVGDGNSADAEFLFNTSIYPLKKGSVFFRFPDNKYSSFPILLAKHGYSNFAIHGDNIEFWNRSVTYPNLGYNSLVGEESMAGNEQIGLGLSDEITFKETVKLIQNIPEPYFAFIITLTSHMPFNLPKAYQCLDFSAFVAKSPMAQYLETIHYADKQLGAFLKELTEQGLLDNTVVCIYGDHEGVHKYYRDDFIKQYGNGKKIPLIIYSLDTNPTTINKIGGQIDIYPTLAYLLGFNQNEFLENIMGNNLMTIRGDGGVVLNDGTYTGDERYRDHCLKGRELSELIIKSNYFATKLDL